MTKEERALIEYRMERARETLGEAKMMFDAGRTNAYVNRLYYACFYAVSALRKMSQAGLNELENLSPTL
jgi:uncharacterized protein (UPF0332 family)